MTLADSKDHKDGHSAWQRVRGPKLNDEEWPKIGVKPQHPKRTNRFEAIGEATEAGVEHGEVGRARESGAAGDEVATEMADASARPEKKNEPKEGGKNVTERAVATGATEGAVVPEAGAPALTGARKSCEKSPEEKIHVPFVVIGDSMMRNLERHVRMSGESNCVSMRGAHMKTVTEKAVEVSAGREDGLMVIQGGGNGLLDRESDATVKIIVDAVQAIKGNNKRIRVAVASIMPRPERVRQPQYEKVRKEVNTKLHEAVLGLNCASLRENGNTGLSFINLDPVLGPGMFGGDGVHLNAKGDASLAQRLIRWIDPSSKYLRMKTVKKPNCDQM